MRYIPHTAEEVAQMLDAIGVESVEQLFDQIPERFRLTGELDLPEPLSEVELLQHLNELGKRNRPVGDGLTFLGGGIYDHYSPVVVDHVLSRSEFYTAYTPYQPEIAQGTLQAIFEFQSMTATLLEMELSNASMYDGSTSVAEAALMAERLKKKKRILVARSLHPGYRAVLKTFLEPLAVQLVEIPFDARTGLLDQAALAEELERGPASGLVVQSPNYFGLIEDQLTLAETMHEQGSLLVSAFTEPLAFGFYAPPGAQGADIVAGEGQSLGIPMSLGGPVVGIFASRQEFVRSMPGRLVGQTVDTKGNRSFVLTMATREQHIRRERATSNICTNQGLCALAAAVYMSTMGPAGLRIVAEQNLDNAYYLRQKIGELEGYAPLFDGPIFNEFVVQTPYPADRLVETLLSRDLVPGIALEKAYPELGNAMLITTTETHSAQDLDRLLLALREAA